MPGIPPISNTPTTPIMDGQGYFTLGSTAILFFDFPDITGNRYDPVNLTATISDPNSQVITTVTSFDKLEIGKYAMTWDIPTTVDTGVFTVLLTFTAETTDGELNLQSSYSFVVGDSLTSVIPARMVASRSALESFIGYAQRIPIFHEIGRFNQARNTAEFSFQRWNQPRIKVYLNGDTLESGYYVNFIDGKIVMDHPLAKTDELFASYTFRWFSDEELYSFLSQAVEVFNQYPPHSAYNITNIENRYVVTVIEQAAIFALRRLMFDLMYQEPDKVFGGMDRADKIIGSLDTLKRNYEDEVNKLYEQKKYGPYTGLTQTITVPEYTLPGGRCFCRNTMVNIELYETNLSKEQEVISVTIEDLYKMYIQNKNIKIQTHHEDKVTFAPIGHIWESGVKDVYTLSTKNGNKINTSEEHLFFIVGKGYIPLKDIKIGQNVLSLNNGELNEDKVVDIKYHDKVLTYDIEVPSTENLIANGIKCHNSRWFRMLFK